MGIVYYEKLVKYIKTKTIRQVKDFKANFIKKVRPRPDHPEYTYLQFFNHQNTKGLTDEDHEFLEFVKEHKYEWRHYYTDFYPDKSYKEASMRFHKLKHRYVLKQDPYYVNIFKGALLDSNENRITYREEVK